MPPFATMSTDPEYLRIPQNKSAVMRLLLEMVQRGSPFWTAGVVAFEKAEGLATKFAERYATQASASQRSRRKADGLASAQLVMYPAAPASAWILWWLLVTPGVGPVVDAERLMDCRKSRESLIFRDAQGVSQYVLDHVQRSRAQGGGRRWTWSLTPRRYQELELRTIDLCRLHGVASQRVDDLQAHIDALLRMPGFHGIRAQVKAVLQLAQKTAHHRISERVDWPARLPIMTKALAVYRQPEPMRLPELVARMHAARSAGLNASKVEEGAPA